MFMLIASFSLLAAQMLDTDMSRQDQKETGLYKLTDKQKLALQKWIDSNYMRKDSPLAATTGAKNQATLEDNINNGRYLRLSDSTSWEIKSEDTPITQGWITPVDIYVSQSGNADYPYILTNSLTESKVRAKKISAIPSSSNK